MERFNLPICQNPLKTRSDVVQALLAMMEPVKAHFTPGFAGIHLGDHGAHYGEKVAEMEAFSRMLWGMAPCGPREKGRNTCPCSGKDLSMAPIRSILPTVARSVTMTSGLWRWLPSP